MKAFVQRAYGSADSLELTDLDTPAPGPGQVLVRVRATSVNPYDWHNMRGEPRVARLMGGMNLRTPTFLVLGCDVAGEVQAVGEGVTAWQPGDRVYALLEQGGFGEYLCAGESALAPMPGNLGFEAAAAVPMAGGTALLALRDTGRLAAGQAVLITGASGGVGTFAVQIAKAMGATVTAVCGPRKVDLVRSIGADEVVDYSTVDFTRAGRRFDLVVDIAGTRSAASCRRLLKPKGAYVVVGGPGGRWVQPVGHLAGMAVVAPFSSQRMAIADIVRHQDKRGLLIALTELIESGRVRPVIDRRYGFADIPEAVRYQEGGHAAGKVVVSF